MIVYKTKRRVYNLQGWSMEPNPGEMMESRFRVGHYVVCVASATVTREGLTTHIDRMALRVLEHLARRGGAPTCRQEILATVWEGRAITDGVLTSAISRLRAALGDRAKSSRLIETLPGFGYRLVAPASFSDANVDGGNREQTPRPEGAWLPRREASAFAGYSAGSPWQRLSPPMQFIVAALAGVGTYLTVVCGLLL